MSENPDQLNSTIAPKSTEQVMNSHSKRFSLIAYYIILSVIGFLALEIGAQFKYKKSHLAANISMNREFHHLLPPYTEGKMHSEGDFDDTFVTNNRGMRGPGDYVYDKDANTIRIAVMGDSFTFGVGVTAEETYSSVLKNYLNQHKPMFDVMNFGVSSSSPILQFIYLKKEVVKYQPDVVLLLLDLCDLQDDYAYEPHLVYDENGEIVACDPYSYKGGPDIWAILRRQSVFLTILNDKLIQSIKKIQTIGIVNYFRNKINGVRNKTEILVNPDIDNIEFDRFIFMRENKNEEIVNKHWLRTAKYLRMIKEFCDQNSIQFVLGSYPYGHQVGENQWSKGRGYWAFESDKTYDASKTFDTLETFARDEGIEFVNLYPPMIQNKDKLLYFTNDGHWTAEAHQIAAQSIAQSTAFQRMTTPPETN